MAALSIKRSGTSGKDEQTQSTKTRRFLPARKGRGRYLLWRNSTILFLIIALYMLFSIQQHFNKLAERAVEDGKRIIIDIKSGEVAMRARSAMSPADEDNILSEDDGQQEAAMTAEPVGSDQLTDSATGAAESVQTAGLDIGAADFEPPELPVIVPNRFTHRLSIIVRKLGLNKAVTDLAITLPAEVQLAFSPYTVDLATTLAKAQEAGHTILLDLPTSTEAFPFADAGPLALMMDALQEQNLYRLQTMLKQGDYAAILFPQRDTVTTSSLASIPILDFLKRKNIPLIYQENSNNDYLSAQAKSVDHPHITSYTVLDNIATREHVYESMVSIRERINANQGNITLVAGPYPLSIKLIGGLVADFTQAGYALATIEDIAE